MMMGQILLVFNVYIHVRLVPAQVLVLLAPAQIIVHFTKIYAHVMLVTMMMK